MCIHALGLFIEIVMRKNAKNPHTHVNNSSKAQKKKWCTCFLGALYVVQDNQ